MPNEMSSLRSLRLDMLSWITGMFTSPRSRCGSARFSHPCDEKVTMPLFNRQKITGVEAMPDRWKNSLVRHDLSQVMGGRGVNAAHETTLPGSLAKNFAVRVP